MAKSLFLCRHAHARANVTGERDYDRELSSAGRLEAAQAGAFIRSFGLTIDAVISSAAVRTQQTAHIIAAILQLDVKSLKISQELYNINSRSLLQQIAAYDNNWQVVIIIGHNPVISDVVSRISNENIYVPAAGCNYFHSDAPDWQSLEWSSLTLEKNY